MLLSLLSVVCLLVDGNVNPQNTFISLHERAKKPTSLFNTFILVLPKVSSPGTQAVSHCWRNMFLLVNSLFNNPSVQKPAVSLGFTGGFLERSGSLDRMEMEGSTSMLRHDRQNTRGGIAVGLLPPSHYQSPGPAPEPCTSDPKMPTCCRCLRINR